MKPLFVIVMFLFFLGTALITGVNSYREARNALVADMNRALDNTLSAQDELWITPDTIRTFRSQLSVQELKERALVCYAADIDKADGVLSDPLILRKNNGFIAYRGYVYCSSATIWGLSDQRLPLTLLAMSMLWALYAIALAVRKRRLPTLATLPLTPMQRQLVDMLLSAHGEMLGKGDICARLWPKKDRPEETLYTLVKRTKQVLETSSNFTIEGERGKGYRLKSKS